MSPAMAWKDYATEKPSAAHASTAHAPVRPGRDVPGAHKRAVNDHRITQVLVVENDARHAELVMRALGGSGLASNVVWVRDCAEAIESVFGAGGFARREPESLFKLVLLCPGTSDADARDLLRRFREDEITRETPVVVLTPQDGAHVVDEYLRLGANSCVVKPVCPNAFFDKLSALGRYWLLTNRIAT